MFVIVCVFGECACVCVGLVQTHHTCYVPWLTCVLFALPPLFLTDVCTPHMV